MLLAAVGGSLRLARRLAGRLALLSGAESAQLSVVSPRNGRNLHQLDVVHAQISRKCAW
jgi:hypothetical protein